MLLGCCVATRAAVAMNAVEVGGNVEITGGGALNLTALTLNDNTYSTQGKIDPIQSEAVLGAAAATAKR